MVDTIEVRYLADLKAQRSHKVRPSLQVNARVTVSSIFTLVDQLMTTTKELPIQLLSRTLL